MFDVYADDKLLYSPRLLDEGYAITEPQATLELNKAGSFTFGLPVVNPLYSSLKKLKTIITIRDDGEVFWKGRVLNDTKDFYNTKSVTCEGELAFLNDIQYEPHDYSKKGIKMGEYFKKLIEHYASECTEERTIKLGIVSGAFADVLIYPKTTDYTNIWNLISGNLIGASKGKVGKDEVDLSDYDRYLYIRRQNGVSYIDFVEDIGKASGQIIEFGKNLLDLSEYVDASNVYTQIIPLGKADSKGNRVDIKLVNGGKNYLESASGIALFGKIQKSVIWDDVTNRNTLKANGQRLLDKAVEMAIKITIRAFDLHQINVSTDKIEFGDKVHVVSLPHEISSDFLCSKIVYHLASLENTEYTFGLEFESMTSNYASYKRTYQYKMESAFDIGNQNAQDILDAGKTATDYIKDNGTGGVQVGPRGDSNVTMTDDGLVFTGIRNMTAIWTNWSAESGMGDGTTVCNDGRLSTYNAVLIGFKEYYNSWFDSGNINGNDIQYHIVLLNDQTSICTRIWDYTRARRVTASKNGITFGMQTSCLANAAAWASIRPALEGQTAGCTWMCAKKRAGGGGERQWKRSLPPS